MTQELFLFQVPEISPKDLDQSEAFMYPEDEQKCPDLDRRETYNRSEAGSPTTYLDISANNMPRVTQMQSGRSLRSGPVFCVLNLTLYA